jgi:hypothetical protein
MKCKCDLVLKTKLFDFQIEKKYDLSYPGNYWSCAKCKRDVVSADLKDRNKKNKADAVKSFYAGLKSLKVREFNLDQ